MSTGVASLAQPAVPIRHRLSVERLSAGQLTHVRRAFTAAQAISDDRGYRHQAGIHGLPLPMYCTHGTPLFLPWHRAYLYFFELALRDHVPDLPGFALPWWDWTSPASHQGGIPAAYGDAQADGAPNPLHAAELDPAAIAQAQAQGQSLSSPTTRQPGNPRDLPTAEHVNAVLGLADFQDFSAQVEDIHNGIHVWVGGDMSEIPVAAYDPIFWAHHAMIDRLWRLWQLRHRTAAVPGSLLHRALPPFPMTVAQTLDMTSLGYDYASFTSHP